MEKSLSQDTQDKEKAIAGIGDNQIREDSMGVPAAITDQSEDSDFLHNGFPMDKVDDAAAIVSMGIRQPKEEPQMGQVSLSGRKESM